MNLHISYILRIIGIVMMVTGVLMFPSLLVSAIYREFSLVILFLLLIISACLAGAFLFLRFRKKVSMLKVRDGFVIVALCWLITVLLGALPFFIGGYLPNFIDAFFESGSGFSTTGASVISNVESLPKGILFWRSFTHWIGGMGILIFAIALMPSLGISGQNIAVAETPGPMLDKISPKMSDTAKTLYLIYSLLTVAEISLLMLNGMNLFDALIHSFGTVGTGGFSSYNDSIAHFDNAGIRAIITLFMFICGVNFNLFILSAKRGLKVFYEDSELKLYTFFFLIFSFIITLYLIAENVFTSVASSVEASVFQVVSILTTTGYASADYETWPPAAQILLLLTMFIGGCSSSTGGGIKVIRVLIILKLIKRGITARLHPNIIDDIKLNGKVIPSDTVSAIASHMFLYTILVFFGALIISFENVDIMTCFSSVITCLGNVGPGFGAVGPSENFSALTALSKGLLSIYMIAGRLELYTLCILLIPHFWDRRY